ncbi:hypothetical protein H257_17087 [Aphanomyces astaci]|uniref:Amino acid transporter transmembrane domain-containing protein n=1 Tax=Aphanomyces astaci TaxID=112090 RepID=W4FGF9_APHAT|nr:hypothetical protein H257_17087 [Aphanomyces astaci]ETV66525.1 hypothetical protein H257_17087 [Aphanomyces astaci]|eukprot:XP_009844054.1 hypothetical protein H257_17087 [Aphanomyces astaci]
MDWSSVFDDDAAAATHNRSRDEKSKISLASSLNEEVEIGETRSSRAAHQLMSFSRSLSFNPAEMDSSSSSYTPLVAYSFTVNYILGVGSLGVPYALYKAGIVFGSVLLVVVSFISYVTVMWVSETTARARDLDAKNSKTKLLRDPFHFPEVTTLCDRFLGVVGATLYQLSLLGLMYGGLLGYSQVFVNSIVSQLPSSFESSTVVVAVVFGLIVVPLSCVDLSEQIHVQVVMAIVRFVALTTMIASATVALFVDTRDSGITSPMIAQGPPYASDVPWMNLDSFGLLFSTTVFSQLFQHSVPGLLAPLARKDQPKAPSIFGYALVTTTLFYLALSLSCCYYFGPKISSSVNLNWASFSWGVDGDVPLWGRFLSFLVVLFPALDTLSVFPLIAITLGDNLAASLKGRLVWLSHKRLICRLVASLPPLVVAVVVTDLSVTLQFSGIFGIYVAFITPALLQLFSRREDPRLNVYSGRFSSDGYIFAVLAFGGVAVVVATVQVFGRP